MPTRSRLISVIGVSGILLLSSCGSSDSGGSSDTSGAAISKADFVEKANALCTTLNANIVKAQDALGSSPTQEQVMAFMTDDLVAQFDDAIGKIRDLGFPAGDEALLDGILDDAEKVLAEITDDPAAVLASAESPFTDVNAGFQDYGLTVCAET